MADESSAGRTLSSYFAATPEELTRIASAPYLAADAAGWREFASAVYRQVIEAYQQGEISLERALQAVLSCSVRCTWQERATLIALTALQALKHPPQTSQKKVQNPLWVRRSAAQLVQMYRQLRPSEAFAPNEMNGWTTPILEDAIVWLRALGLCDDVTARVLYAWYSDAKKAGVFEPHDSVAGI
jgi:hypothetical protein